MDRRSRRRYDKAAPSAIAAVKRFNEWLSSGLAGRKTDRTWRLGKALYDEKFRYALGASSTPGQVLADAEAELVHTRAEMMQLALPLHAQWWPGHGEHANLAGEDRENAVLGEVTAAGLRRSPAPRRVARCGQQGPRAHHRVHP